MKATLLILAVVALVGVGMVERRQPQRLKQPSRRSLVRIHIGFWCADANPRFFGRSRELILNLCGLRDVRSIAYLARLR